jgi:hypothetical protein
MISQDQMYFMQAAEVAAVLVVMVRVAVRAAEAVAVAVNMQETELMVEVVQMEDMQMPLIL